MNDRTREQLLGYLLDALEENERDQVEQQLEANPDWRTELDTLATTLEPLAESYTEFEPPPGLATRTCAVVEDQLPAPASVAFPASMANEVQPRGSWAMADVIVVAGICLVAAMLFFPAIEQSRYAARLAACQNNLRQLGMSLIDYSEKAGAGYFPEVPTSGNRGFAGVYGPILVDGGYLTDSQVLVCPSSTFAAEFGDFQVPAMADIDQASGATLVVMQRMSGGSYAYSLGVVVNGEHRAPYNQGRSFFTLMADAPNLKMAGYRSLNHGGRGQNFLYEDGHVRYVIEACDAGLCDHPFENRMGWTEAGLDINDSVIAPSWSPPFVSVSHVRSQ